MGWSRNPRICSWNVVGTWGPKQVYCNGIPSIFLEFPRLGSSPFRGTLTALPGVLQKALKIRGLGLI